MEAALYDPDGGFFARGGGAGREGGDFLTSPEVGSFFGLLVGRALDQWWTELRRPDPYLVVDAGAARGRLAADILRADPACAPALRLVLVERSAAQRAAQSELVALEPPHLAAGPSEVTDPDEPPEPVEGAGPVVTSLHDLPAGSHVGVVIANELADNLPFRLVERAVSPRSPDLSEGASRPAVSPVAGAASPSAGWLEVRVGESRDDAGRFVEVLVTADPDLAAAADDVLDGAPVSPGDRLPIPTGLDAWLADCAGLLRRGFVVLVDYADETAGLLARGPSGWLRTYRRQQPGGPPLADPGTQDITADVPLPALRRAAARSGFTVRAETTQAEWLTVLGAEPLVEEARAVWHARSATDLTAVKARSRVHEYDALTDPAGLGAHRVIVLERK